MSERRHRTTQKRQFKMPAAVRVIAFIGILAVGYLLGMYHTVLYNAIAPVFGVRVATDQLDLSSVQETYKQLQLHYDGSLDKDALVEGANKGLVDAVGDEYTVYLNNKESQAFSDDLSGNVGAGVGIEIGLRNDAITVLRTLKDNPAEAAGLMASDTITAVNGESTSGWSVQDAVDKIRGEAGTTVKLTILRGTDTQDYTITRAQINNPSVYTKIQSSVGIITITRFDTQTGSLTRSAARELKDKGVTGIILDLRGNGGGYLTAAQEVAGIWLRDKVVVTERSNGVVIDQLTSGNNPVIEGMPTVVLVNGSSASASEIVAGALQDHGVATLLGEKTFGKGSVQKLIRLPHGAELKVTTARWYTPNGKNISDQGITPDTAINLDQADINSGKDPQLTAAIKALQ